MADEWFYGRDGQNTGPVGFDQLVELARSGELQPADLVWQEGMADWILARRVDGLNFPAPFAASVRSASWLDSALRHLGKQPDEAIATWLMKPKPGSRLALSIISMAAMLAIAAFFALSAFVFAPLILVTFLFLWLAGIGLLMSLVSAVDIPKRKQQLIGRWEAVEGDAPAIQFTTDGNVVRSDGVSGQYNYSVLKEALTVSIDHALPVELRVTSISAHELHVSDGSTTSYYKKGKTLTDVEQEKQMEAAKAKMLAIGKTAAVVAGATAMAGLAVLGAAAEGMAKNAAHDAQVRKRPCPSCGTLVPVDKSLCINCGQMI